MLPTRSGRAAASQVLAMPVGIAVLRASHPASRVPHRRHAAGNHADVVAVETGNGVAVDLVGRTAIEFDSSRLFLGHGAGRAYARPAPLLQACAAMPAGSTSFMKLGSL